MRFSPISGVNPDGNIYDNNGHLIGHWDPADVDPSGRIRMTDLEGRPAVPVQNTRGQVIGFTSDPDANTFTAVDDQGRLQPMRGAPSSRSVIGTEQPDGRVVDARGREIGRRVDQIDSQGNARSTYVDLDGNPMTTVDTPDGQQIVRPGAGRFRTPVVGTEAPDGTLLDRNGTVVGRRTGEVGYNGQPIYVDTDGNTINVGSIESRDPSARIIGAGPEQAVQFGDGLVQVPDGPPRPTVPADPDSPAPTNARAGLPPEVRAEWDRVGAGPNGELRGPSGNVIGHIDSNGAMWTSDPIPREITTTTGGGSGRSPQFMDPDSGQPIGTDTGSSRPVTGTDSRGNAISNVPAEDLVNRVMEGGNAPSHQSDTNLTQLGDGSAPRVAPPADYLESGLPTDPAPPGPPPAVEPGAPGYGGADAPTVNADTPHTTGPTTDAPTVNADTPHTTGPTTDADAGRADGGSGTSAAAALVGDALDVANNFHTNVTNNNMSPTEALGVAVAQTTAGNVAADSAQQAGMGLTQAPTAVTNIGGSLAANSLLPGGLINLMPDQMAANTVVTGYQGVNAALGAEGDFVDFVNDVAARPGVDPYAGYARAVQELSNVADGQYDSSASTTLGDHLAVANEDAASFQADVADGKYGTPLQGLDHLVRGASDLATDRAATVSDAASALGEVGADFIQHPQAMISDAVNHFQSTSRHGDYGMISQGFSEIAHETGQFIADPTQYARDAGAGFAEYGRELGEWIGWQ